MKKIVVVVAASLFVNLAAFAQVGPDNAGAVDCSKVKQALENAKNSGGADQQPAAGDDKSSTNAN